MATTRFLMWHGSRRWDGSPELRPAKKGRAEWGAGIYGTTHYETAQKYAKGGGKVRLLALEPGVILEQALIPLSEAVEFVRQKLPRRLNADIIDSLEENSRRIADRLDRYPSKLGMLESGDAWVPAIVLRNLCVNYDLSTGERGLAVSQFLAHKGISYSIDRGGSGHKEAWIVIFDPKKIISAQPHTFETASEVGHELQNPLEQLGAKRAEIGLEP